MFKTLLSLIALLFCTSCSDQHRQHQQEFEKWIAPNGKVKVLSTTGVIHDLVKQVGGDHVDSIALIQGELDPHSYQLVKGDDEKLSFAHLIFYNGLGLEHGPSLQSYLLHHQKAYSLGDHLFQKEPTWVIEVNRQKDPHIWMDISLWAETVPLIVQALQSQDPSHAALYQAKGEKLVAEMKKAHEEVKEIMHRVSPAKRYLVTSHDAFNYFARAYLSEEGERESGEWQKRFAAPEGLAPESQLSTTQIRAIIDYLKEHQIHRLFPESNVSQDSIRKIIQAGREQGLEISIACCALYADALGAPGSEGDSYLKMLLYDAKILSQHMAP